MRRGWGAVGSNCWDEGEDEDTVFVLICSLKIDKNCHILWSVRENFFAFGVYPDLVPKFLLWDALLAAWRCLLKLECHGAYLNKSSELSANFVFEVTLRFEEWGPWIRRCTHEERFEELKVRRVWGLWGRGARKSARSSWGEHEENFFAHLCANVTKVVCTHNIVRLLGAMNYES